MIEVKNLTKYYGKKIAVNNLNFTVNKNEIIGLLAPNGAGKSTTMNIITGYIAPSSGDVIIDPQIKIGYLPENPPLYPDMKVIEYLKFVSELKCANKNNLTDIIQKFKIDDVTDKLIKNLSKGYKQRVGFAQALIGDPEILILDEPMSGLDPKQITEIRDLIKSLKENHTILISSHILSEIDAIADRIIILNKGEIVADATTFELSKNFSRTPKIIVRIRGPHEKIIEQVKIFANIVESKKGIEDFATDLILENKNEGDIREKIFQFAKENDLILLMMKPFDITLEEIFLQVTQGDAKKC